MSNYLIVTICSHSAALPAIMGLIRWRKASKVYHPFFLVLLLGWFNELLSTILIAEKVNNNINSNIYVFLEFLCVLLLFRNWGTKRHRFVFYTIAAVIVTVIWFADNIVVHALNEFNENYRLSYSMLLAFLSVDQINHVVFIERGKIIRNPKFIICTAFLLYYTFKGIMQSFFVFDLGLSMDFFSEFLLIMTIVNVLANLLYTVAILWMPTKKNFLVRY